MSGTKKYYGGALFVNKNKKNEKAPDLSGDMELSPEDFEKLMAMHKAREPIMLRAAAWIKEGRSGKFYSMTLAPKEEYQGRGGSQSGNSKSRNNDMDDDIPF
jgi:hypothetical protein